MRLPLSVNERFGRIASVAQGARADGWQKLLPLAVSALLVVLLAWQLVQLAWTLLGAGKTAAPAAATAAAMSNSAWSRARANCAADHMPLNSPR